LAARVRTAMVVRLKSAGVLGTPTGEDGSPKHSGELENSAPTGEVPTHSHAEDRGRLQRRIRDAYSFPERLLPNSMTNVRSFGERIEFFLGPPGSGADLHVDSICEPILSVQIQGRKKWWLLPMPPYEISTRESAKDFWRQFPPNVSSKLPSAFWELDIGPGEALLFPAGVAHHTKVVGDVCSVSASLQFRHPFGVQFVRDFAQRLVFSKENSFCFVEVWSVFLTGYYRGLVRFHKAVRRRLRFPERSEEAQPGDRGIGRAGRGYRDVPRHRHER